MARVDLKADRSAGRLVVQAAYLEAGANAVDVADALARELRTMAGWLGLESVVLKEAGGFAKRLRAAVRASNS